MEVLAALGLGAKELFSYNRENFKFDQDQRIERETLRYEMQVKRFELFREDVRDLVELTVDRMDVYHLVGALFLEFCIVLFCEGRVQASAPPFLLSMFLLSNACAFIYLLLAVWLSMHASIASHSFGVRLLTRFVRLPIPSVKQMGLLRTQLKDYERQSVANLLRLPFLDKKTQDWEAMHAKKDDAPEAGAAFKPEPRGSASSAARGATSPRSLGPPGAGVAKRSTSHLLSATSGAMLEGLGATAPTTLGRSSVPSPDSGGASSSTGGLPSASSVPDWAVGPASSGGGVGDDMLLAEVAENPFGGDEMLEAARGAMPERHVQLFRQLQSKWQCYDAYCRVCMGLGVNQILQGLSYYAICHTLVENHSPTTGYALVVLFQSTTVALAVLDLAGMKRREILAVQVVGIMPCLITAVGVAQGNRNEKGELDPNETYMASPLSFLFQTLWLELWLRVAAPSEDQAKLPRRFRQVLFLDVFGDSTGWDPSQAENDEFVDGDAQMMGELAMPFGDTEEDDDTRMLRDDLKALDMLTEQAGSQLTVAQSACRRWLSTPSWALGKDQHVQFIALRDSLNSWGNTISSELQRYSELRKVQLATIFETVLRPWSELDAEEKAADPFANCLTGPFEHDAGYQTSTYHYDVEAQQTLFEDAVIKERPGALVLSLEAVATIISDLEKDARMLLESRITQDLRAEMRRRKAKAKADTTSKKALRLRRAAGAVERTRSALPGDRFLEVDGPGGNRADRGSGPPQDPVSAAVAYFPNLVALFKTKVSSKDRQSFELLLNQEDGPREASHTPRGTPRIGPPQPLTGAPDARRRGGPDKTLVAMAGQHARHFVPERLPWQVLSRMTRVLQCCWLFSAIMASLKELGFYQIDFQEHPGGERRRLAAARPPMAFQQLRVRWPHGGLFRPQALACSSSPGRAGAPGEEDCEDAGTCATGENVSASLMMSSPYGIYAATATAEHSLDDAIGWTSSVSSRGGVWRLEELERTSVLSSTVFLCEPRNFSLHSSPQLELTRCLSASPVSGGVEVRALASERGDSRDEEAVLLTVVGKPWRLLAGGLVKCTNVRGLLAPGALSSTWCLLVAGWDGELLPVAAVPLPRGPGRPPAPGQRLSPAFDAPLPPAEAEKGIVALHVEPRRGRLWALLASGVLEAWDLIGARSLGHRRLRWPPGTAGFRATALCEDVARGVLLAAGRSELAGPLLLEAAVPAELRGGRSGASFLGA